MQKCSQICPDLHVPCDSRPHGTGVAHPAGGTAADGTRWSLFWWRPGEVVDPPVPVADRTAGSPG
jgi:hypothetical protein